MGNILTRILDGPVPQGKYDVEEYQKALRTRRRVLFGSISGSLLVVGYVASKSVFIGMYLATLSFHRSLLNLNFSLGESASPPFLIL